MKPTLFVLLGAALATTAFADATFHQVMEFKSPLIAMMPAGAASLPFGKPTEVVCKIKGTHAYSGFGAAGWISDSTNGDVTLLDTAGKRYATTTLSEFLSKLSPPGGASQMPEAARQILGNMQMKVDSHDTGRSERIQGIDTNETETTITITMPLPMPMPGANSNTIEITGSIRIWKPKPGEVDRVPALREITTYYQQWGKMGGGDLASMLKQILGALPGLGDKVSELTDAMQKDPAVIVRMRGAFSVPALAAMLQQSNAAGAMPDGPLLEINSDLKEIDNDAIPDSAFQIPAGYKEAPVADLIKGLMPMAK
jgi:hypothetical protein